MRTHIMNCGLGDDPYAGVWRPGPNGTPLPENADEAQIRIYNFGVTLYEAGILDHTAFSFTAEEMQGRILMTWTFDHPPSHWTFNGLRESENFGPSGQNTATIMMPGAM